MELKKKKIKMGDFGEPGGAYEQLERMAFGAEEIRFATPEERGIGPMKVELKEVQVFGFNSDGVVENLNDAICSYAVNNGYKTFFQGERSIVSQRIRFKASQRVLYLEHFLDSDVLNDLKVFGKNLSAVLGEMQKRKLVREVVGG